MGQLPPPPTGIDPIPARDRIRFRITWPSLIALTLGTVVAFGATLRGDRSGSDSAPQMGVLPAMFVTATLFSWIMFHIRRRSQRAATITFIMFVGLLTFGYVGQANGTGEETRRAFALAEARFRLEVQDAKTASERSAAVDRFQQRLQDVPGSANPEAQAAMRVMVLIQKVSCSHAEAVERVDQAKVLVFSGVLSPEQMAERRRLVQDAIDAASAVLDTVRRFDEFAHQELRRAGVPADSIDGYARSLRDSYAKQLPQIVRLRELDREIGKEMLAVLDLLSQQRGHWHTSDSGVPIFDDVEQARQYDLLLGCIDRLATQSEQIQRDLAATAR